MKPLSVYIHVPFCVRKCDYCDFASYAGREDRIAPYFCALSEEMRGWADSLCTHRVRSVFFGGGTPSLVDAGYIARALNELRAYAEFNDDAEITLEANPGTIDARKLDTYREAGINRLSIGVQSFDAGLLASIGRIHDPAQAADAVRLARACGFDNISLDLMYALPGQTMQIWRDTLDAACALPIRHISAYSLIVEDGTRMADRVQRGAAIVPDDDTVNEMQRMAVRMLAARGFERYEISNFAQIGYESRHNLNYWLGGEYLGLGSAAHSLLNNERFANPPQIDRYIVGERRLNREIRTENDCMEEMIMLQTRTVHGLDLAEWQSRFGADFVVSHDRAVRKLENYGMIEIENGFLRLTPIGLEMQDSVVLELM